MLIKLIRLVGTIFNLMSNLPTPDFRLFKTSLFFFFANVDVSKPVAFFTSDFAA